MSELAPDNSLVTPIDQANTLTPICFSLESAVNESNRLQRLLSLPKRAAGTFRKALATAGVIIAAGALAPIAMAEYEPFPYAGKQGHVGAVGEHKLAVVPVNFRSGPNPELALTGEQIDQALFTAPGSVSNYFADASFGQFQLDGDVLSPVTVPPYLERSCGGAHNFLQIGKAANAEIEQSAAGNTFNNYDNYMYIFPRQTNCINVNNNRVLNGRTIGNVSFINSQPTPHEGMYVHELSHEFGLSHANALHCKSSRGRRIVPPLGFSYNCTEATYQDPFDPMGYAALRATAPIDFDALNKARLGWLKPDNIQTVAHSTTVEIAPDEISSNEPQLIRVPYGRDYIYGEKQYLYIDYRQPLGEDAKVAPTAPISSMFRGVTLREAGPIGYGGLITLGEFTDLIDTRPHTAAMSDAPLSTGRTYHDKATGITVKTLSVQPSGAEVRIKIPKRIH
jgi:M6 family metalloprotease-like protein